MTRPPLEATAITPYLGFLFFMLATVTLADGFDAAMMTVAAPDARETLGISRPQWGVVFGITRAGMIASFFLLLFADRWGRRAMLAVTVAGFALFNAMTAFAGTTAEFTFFLFMARLFLTGAFALAVIVVVEEYPAAARGRATAVLTSLAPIGLILVAFTQAYVLLEPGAEGNWLHDTGMSALLALQGAIGMEARPENWRVLYLIGGVPVVLAVVILFGMRETRRFQAVRDEQGARRTWAEEARFHLRNARVPWQAE
jgi:MFS family permease